MITFAEMNFINNSKIERLVQSKALHDLLLSSKYSLITRSYDDITVLNNQPVFKFVFVRHPFERLVSAYHDKFIVTKQQNIMRPMIKYQQELVKNNGTYWNAVFLKVPNITFPNFVDFVLHEAQNTKGRIDGSSIHWWPFTQLCRLCEIKYDMIGHVETFNNDAQKIIDHFPHYAILHSMQNRLNRKVNGGHTQHTRDLTLKYFSQLTKQSISKLYFRYNHDFKLGGYEFPQKYIKQGINSE